MEYNFHEDMNNPSRLLEIRILSAWIEEKYHARDNRIVCWWCMRQSHHHYTPSKGPVGHIQKQLAT